jgi:hypothetical protein
LIRQCVDIINLNRRTRFHAKPHSSAKNCKYENPLLFLRRGARAGGRGGRFSPQNSNSPTTLSVAPRCAALNSRAASAIAIRRSESRSNPCA